MQSKKQHFDISLLSVPDCIIKDIILLLSSYGFENALSLGSTCKRFRKIFLDSLEPLSVITRSGTKFNRASTIYNEIIKSHNSSEGRLVILYSKHENVISCITYNGYYITCYRYWEKNGNSFTPLLYALYGHSSIEKTINDNIEKGVEYWPCIINKIPTGEEALRLIPKSNGEGYHEIYHFVKKSLDVDGCWEIDVDTVTFCDHFKHPLFDRLLQ